MKNILLLLISTLFLASCAGTVKTSQPVGVQPYVLGIGDTIALTVYGHDDLSGSFTVNPEGVLPLPLIKDVSAAGFTTQELENSITTRLSGGYIPDPRVSVQINAFRNIYILGEVNAPGQYEYKPNMTVLQAVAMAGGHSYRANESSADITRHVREGIATFKVGNNTILKPGDTITIGRRWF